MARGDQASFRYEREPRQNFNDLMILSVVGSVLKLE